MTKKLLVTGAGGFVGGSVVVQAEKEWDVHGVVRQDHLPPKNAVRFHRLDLQDAEKLVQLFKEIKPHAVIHAAAIANIDFCQEHREQAEAVNVGVTQHLAELCAEVDFVDIDPVTYNVFDGRKGFYVEEDEPHPVNFYAETKVRAEKIVARMENSVVARLSLVMGLPLLGAGNSFLAKMLTKLEEGETIKVPENEIRTPVDVITLGRALLELAENDFGGVIHLAGSDRLARYDMARRIAAHLGLPRELIVAVNSNAIPGRAPALKMHRWTIQKRKRCCERRCIRCREGWN